jgi:proline iminopeptidase
MAWGTAQSTAFFEQDAAEERKQVLRDNLAKLPPDAPPGQFLFAQTPLRFFDPRFDAAPLFAGAEINPGLLGHILGPLTSGWDVTVEASSLQVPVFLAHGRFDYIVPHVLWNGIPAQLPDATFHLFERSGHQPFVEEPERFTQALTDWTATRPW